MLLRSAHQITRHYAVLHFTHDFSRGWSKLTQTCLKFCVNGYTVVNNCTFAVNGYLFTLLLNIRYTVNYEYI
jgi:hypothetical protein